MPSDDTRERSIAKLRRGYELGRMSTDTLERRIDCALRTQHTGELEALTARIPGGAFARAARALQAALSSGEPMPSLLHGADRVRVTIGRDPACQILLEDDSVSRRHADLELVEGRWRLRDCSSTNGTWVNGRRLHGALEIERGDVLTFGQVSARF